MGARAKRRLAIGTVATLVSVGAVAVLVIAWSGSSSRSGSQSQTSKQTSKEVYGTFGTFGTFGVVYGVHGSQLLARFGAPDQKRHGCWMYRIRGEAFHGIKLIPQIAGMDAVRYCFYNGVVAIIKDHWRPGTYNPQLGPWTAPVTYGCGGGPCKHQAP
jgi:hypothetical protein